MTTSQKTKVIFKRSNFVKDITGKRYGKLRVISFAYSKDSLAYWNCKCDCGNKKVIRGQSIKAGLTTSCGCVAMDFIRNLNKSHGHCINRKKNGIYAVWCGMISRCENPKNIKYANYGGRGIKVCKRWRNSYQNFLDDMGERPKQTKQRQYSIERIEYDGDYKLSNCKWATQIEQCNNTSSNTRLTFNGDNLTLAQWARKIDIRYGTILNRVKAKWPIERILSSKDGRKTRLSI